MSAEPTSTEATFTHPQRHGKLAAQAAHIAWLLETDTTDGCIITMGRDGSECHRHGGAWPHGQAILDTPNEGAR